MQITSVIIRSIFDDEKTLKAVASIIFDDVFAVHDVKIICASGRFFVVMPTRMYGKANQRDAAHPITAEFRTYLEETVIEAYFREKEARLSAEDQTPTEEETTSNS